MQPLQATSNVGRVVGYCILLSDAAGRPLTFVDGYLMLQFDHGGLDRSFCGAYEHHVFTVDLPRHTPVWLIAPEHVRAVRQEV